MICDTANDKCTVTRILRLILLTLSVLTLTLSAIACQTSIDDRTSRTATLPLQYATATAEAVPAPSCGDDVTFVLTIDGSELITPVTKRIADEFMAQTSCVHVVVDSNGTRRGFERLCSGTVHINEAYLWFQSVDSELCRQNDIEWLELPIMWDNFGNFVSARNDFVECITVDQNRQIWSPTGAANIWSELVSYWPNEEIHRYAALNVRGSPIFADDPSYSDAERLDCFDLAMVDDLATDLFGIGLFSTAHYAGNEDQIRPISIDVGEGCISTDPLVVEPGQRPVWGHPIHIYVDRQALRDNQVLREFLDFYMAKALTVTREQGFFALSPEEYEENRDLIRTSAVAP